MNLLALAAIATLAWDATPEPGVAAYIVEMKTGEPWEQLAVVPAPATTLVITLPDHTPRTYAVRAHNAAGTGPRSNELTLALVTLESSADLSAWNDIADAVIELTPATFFRIKTSGVEIPVGKRTLKP